MMNNLDFIKIKKKKKLLLNKKQCQENEDKPHIGRNNIQKIDLKKDCHSKYAKNF